MSDHTSAFDAPDTENGYEQRQTSSSDDGSMDKMPGPSNKKRLSGFKAKTKKLFKLDGAVDDLSEHGEKDPLEGMENNPAFNSSKLIKKRRFRPGKTADKTVSAFQSIGNAVVHPIKSAKSTATRTTAGQLSKAERPFISQKADIEFLQAHDNLRRAESISSSKQGTSDEESLIGGHRDKIRELEGHRESLPAAWTTSRHVRRVRVVPKRHFNFSNNGHRNERQEFVGDDWLKWLGHVILQWFGF